jgi:hypothetical protein
MISDTARAGLELLKGGAVALKHGRAGQPKETIFTLSADEKRLTWAPMQKKSMLKSMGSYAIGSSKSDEDRQMRLADVVELLVGRETPIFQRAGNDAGGSEHLSLSLVLSAAQRSAGRESLDVSFGEGGEETFGLWVAALRHLLNKGKPTQLIRGSSMASMERVEPRSVPAEEPLFTLSPQPVAVSAPASPVPARPSESARPADPFRGPGGLMEDLLPGGPMGLLDSMVPDGSGLGELLDMAAGDALMSSARAAAAMAGTLCAIEQMLAATHADQLRAALSEAQSTPGVPTEALSLASRRLLVMQAPDGGREEMQVRGALIASDGLLLRQAGGDADEMSSDCASECL